MELSIIERILLISILPKEGDFTTLKLLRTLKEALSFDEEENKALKFAPGEGGALKWDADEAKNLGDKDVKIGEIMTEKIKEILKKMNKDKTLREEHISLYEKFVESD